MMTWSEQLPFLFCLFLLFFLFSSSFLLKRFFTENLHASLFHRMGSSSFFLPFQEFMKLTHTKKSFIKKKNSTENRKIKKTKIFFCQTSLFFFFFLIHSHTLFN